MPCAQYARTPSTGAEDYTECVCPDNSVADTKHEDAVLNEADVKCQCLAGFYMELNQDGKTFKCEPCPLHTYNPAIAAISRKECLECPEHSLTEQTGSSLYTQCVCPEFAYFDVDASLEASICLCPIGRFMDPLALVCEACPQGRYGTVEGT
jgi:hypothetical protein